jgi:hypothetical protein
VNNKNIVNSARSAIQIYQKKGSEKEDIALQNLFMPINNVATRKNTLGRDMF